MEPHESEEMMMSTHEWKRHHPKHSFLVKVVKWVVGIAMAVGAMYGVYILLKKLMSKKKMCSEKKIWELLQKHMTNLTVGDDFSCTPSKGVCTLTDTSQNYRDVGLIMTAAFKHYPTSIATTWLDDTGDGCVFLASNNKGFCEGVGSSPSMGFVSSSADADTQKKFSQAAVCADSCKGREFWVAGNAANALPECGCLCGPKKK